MAASLMKALIVCMLIWRVHRVAAGETIFVHAAAGGVDRLLCNWASYLGAVGADTFDASIASLRSEGHWLLEARQSPGGVALSP